MRKHNGSSIEFSDASNKRITIIRTQYFDNTNETNVQETVYDLDENGKVKMNVEIAKNESGFHLKVEIQKLQKSEFISIVLILNCRQNI